MTRSRNSLIMQESTRFAQENRRRLSSSCVCTHVRRSPADLWWIVVLGATFLAACSKPAEPSRPATVAPPSQADAAAVARVNSALRDAAQAKMKADGLLPGTPEFTKRQEGLRREYEQKIAAAAKAFSDLEGTWLKKIDEELVPIEQFVKDQEPDIFDLKVIGADPDVCLEADRSAYLYGLRLGEIAVYQELTQDPKNARIAAMRFLQSFVAANTNQTRFRDVKSLQELAAEALKAGSNDPLIQLHHALLVWANPASYSDVEFKDAQLALKKIAPVFEKESKYPRFFAFLAKVFETQMAKRSQGAYMPVESSHWIPSWLDWLAEMSEDRRNLSFAYTNSVSTLRELTSTQKREFYSAVMQRAGIDPWLVHMFGGYYNHALAWEYRGGGFANTVTQEGWEKLCEHQDLAKRHFLRAYALQPRLPEAPGEMMKIALTENSVGTSTEWFLRTVKVCFDYAEAYESLEWSLRPRWGGSIPELLALSKACLDTERFDTSVPGIGLKFLIQTQQSELGLSSSIFQDESLLPALYRYADAYDLALTQKTGFPPRAEDVIQDQSRLAALFAHGNDISRARKILLSIAHNILKEPFASLELPPRYTIGRILSSSPEQSEAVQKLHEIIQAGVNSKSTPQDFKQASELLLTLRQALGVPSKDDAASLNQQWDAANDTKPEAIALLRVRSFLLNVETTLKRLKQFASNEWVKLTVDDLATGWEIAANRSKYLVPDGIELTCEGQIHTYGLRSLARFEPPYDVQVTLQAIYQGILAPIPPTGISLGPTDVRAFEPNRKAAGLRQFCVSPLSNFASVATINGDDNLLNVPPNKDYIVRVKVWQGGRYQFSVNDLRLFDATDKGFTPGNTLVFGSTLPSTSTGTVQLKWMQIRRLTREPPTDGNDHVGVEAFARHEIQFDEEDAMAHFDLGRSLYFQGKYTDALRSLNSAAAIQPKISDWGLKILRLSCYTKLKQIPAALKEYDLQKSEFVQIRNDLGEAAVMELAQLLATSRDAALRDGKNALRIAQNLNISSTPRWDYMWVLAAAHAECGEFDMASRRLDQCLAICPADKKDFVKGLQKTFAERRPYRIK